MEAGAAGQLSLKHERASPPLVDKSCFSRKKKKTRGTLCAVVQLEEYRACPRVKDR